MRRHVVRGVLALAVLAYPLLVPRFWTEGVATEACILALIGLSLTFLTTFGGMVSLCQLTLGGISGYSFAIIAANVLTGRLDISLWVAAVIALVTTAIAALLVALLAVRTSGVYLLMLTMAIAVGFAAFARQNYELMRGFDGFSGVPRPPLPFDVNDPTVFYYLTLAVVAASYFALKWVSTSSFGLSLQAIRDHAGRAQSLGYRVDAHRVIAFVVSGLVAGAGGLLGIWYQGRIAPSAVDIGPTLDILVLCTLGGLYSLRGALLGAFAFRLLTLFASDIVGPQHATLFTGAAFLLVMMFSAAGIDGLLVRTSGFLSRLRRSSAYDVVGSGTREPFTG